jgi:hypothetical protein
MATTDSWPPKQGLGTVSVLRKDASFATHAPATRIKAPAKLVFDILCHVDGYAEWNTWIPTVHIVEQPEGTPKDSKILELGTRFVFDVIMSSSMTVPTSLKICDISTPEKPSSYVPEDILKDGSFTEDLSTLYRIAWKSDGGLFSRGLIAERFHEIIIISDDECEVREWEAQGGMLASTVKFMYKKTLDKKFAQWNEELKKAAEEKVSKASS